MATFNVSFAQKKAARSASQDYGILVDQLDILESRLSSDGKLSPGDYQLLNEKAMQLYAHPGLSPANRSNIEVKIAGYKASASKTVLKDTQDVGRMDRDVQNDTNKLAIAYGNDPQTFLSGKISLLEAKMFKLQENADDQERAGDDSTQTQIELQKTRDEWIDSQSALEAAKVYQPGAAPQSDFVAYVETNSKGEIRNIDIVRSSSTKQGYLPTTGVLGGFQVYGKVNSKVSSQEGKNVFKLGNTVFSASNRLIPSNDGSFKQETLTTQDQQVPVGTRGRTKAVGEFVDLNPVEVKTQKFTRPGEWIQSGSDFYKDLGGGQYERFVGTTKEKLGLNDEDVLSNLPNEMLSKVKQSTVKTNDMAPSVALPSMSPNASIPTASTTPTSTSTPISSAPVSVKSDMAAPTYRAPGSAQGIASKAFGAAKSFLGRLFGGAE